MPRCIGIMGWIFGHRYEARFSLREHMRPSEITAEKITASDFRLMITLTDKLYHGDVCSRCSSMVNIIKETPDGLQHQS